MSGIRANVEAKDADRRIRPLGTAASLWCAPGPGTSAADLFDGKSILCEVDAKTEDAGRARRGFPAVPPIRGVYSPGPGTKVSALWKRRDVEPNERERRKPLGEPISAPVTAL